MTTEKQLRETLSAHADEGHDNPARVSEVRRRVRTHRQRRSAVASVAAVAAVAAVAVVAAVVVPVATLHHNRPSRIGAAASPSSQTVSAAPSDSPTPSPTDSNPEFAQGGRKLAGADATSPTDGSLTYTFTPTSYQLFLSIACNMPSGQVAITINGHYVVGSTCQPGVGGGIGAPSNPMASAEQWSPVVRLDQPNTLVMTQVTVTTPPTSETPLPVDQREPGTFSSAIYQVPLTS